MTNLPSNTTEANLVGEEPIVVERSTAPSTTLAPVDWIKQNLFSNVRNSIITLIVGALAAIAIYSGVRWIIGADFEIVRVNLRNFMIGQFPRDELWRPWASGLIIATTLGLVSGALAHNAYDTAQQMGVPAHRDSYPQLVRRFWPLIAVMIFFVSFARTVLPYIGLASVFVVVLLFREIGWRLPASFRSRVVYVGAILAVLSMLVIAGTSNLGGLAMGIIAAVWMASEVGRMTPLPGMAGTLRTFGLSALAFVIAYFVVALIPFDGFGWEDWGGIHISLFTMVIGITLGMPFGILLAIGRRSNLPVIKTASTIFIEFVRGVPLISLLLFSNLMLRNFFPLSFEIPADLTMAIIVITGFSAAYIAEIVRGGLQAVPKGQTEAAQASGMSPGKVQRLIVLPQALRAVIPAMVGQFISLFKDTSLLSIIGITEFLRVTDVANAQPAFSGKQLAPVTYLFVAIGYWAFAYTMSRESRRLETKLGIGVR